VDNYYGSGYDLVHGGGDTYWYTGYKYAAPDYSVVISKTVNNGSSWTRYTLSSGTDYRYCRALAVDPSDNDKVFSLVYEGSSWKVYSTDDGGASWESVTAAGWSGTPYRLVVNPSNGNHLAAASSSGLYWSSNGGASWARVTTAFGSSLDAVQTGDGAGLIVGTSSQGVWLWEDWSGSPTQITSDPASISCLYDSESLYLYAGTPASSVWRSYNGTGVEGETRAPLQAFDLAASPNPSSGGAVCLGFRIPFQGGVRLEVFDLAGRLVWGGTLADLPGGEHTVSIPADRLVPGVYLIRMEHSGVSGSTRLVVTR
jgi:hypothetical protein